VAQKSLPPKLGIGADISTLDTRDGKCIKISGLLTKSMHSLVLEPAATAPAVAPFPATLFAGMHRNLSSALVAAEAFEVFGDGSGL
jgi:hypothetical protein